MLDFDKYECYNLPHVTTCPSLPYILDIEPRRSTNQEKTIMKLLKSREVTSST